MFLEKIQKIKMFSSSSKKYQRIQILNKYFNKYLIIQTDKFKNQNINWEKLNANIL